jgi:hypothetical protein
MFATGSVTQYNVDVQLRYFGFGWTGDGRFNTQIKSTFVGVLVKKMNSNDEGRVKDFTFLGGGTAGVDDGIGEGFGVDGVIGMGADGSGAGWTRMQMTNVHWRHMAQEFEIQKSLWCTFINVYARFVRRGAFFVGGAGQGAWNTDWFNNQITFLNCLWDDTGEYAIDYVGSGLALAGTNTMQSGVDGLRINRDPANRSNNNTIDNLYTEFNSGSDMIFDGVKVTIGTVQYQGGSGTVPKPDTLNNILANNSIITVTGRPSILDTQIARITLTNNSKYIAMYPEIVSAKNTADATSKFVYIPDLLEDRVVRQTITDLTDATPITINGGNRLANGSWKIFVKSPGGEFASGTIETSATGGLFRMTVFGRQMAEDTQLQFTINQTTDDYVIVLDASTGNATIANANAGTITGETMINLLQTMNELGEFF